MQLELLLKGIRRRLGKIKASVFSKNITEPISNVLVTRFKGSGNWYCQKHGHTSARSEFVCAHILAFKDLHRSKAT